MNAHSNFRILGRWIYYKNILCSFVTAPCAGMTGTIFFVLRQYGVTQPPLMPCCQVDGLMPSRLAARLPSQ